MDYARGLTDRSSGIEEAESMDLQQLPVIIALERVGGGAVVRFADGRCVFFSALLLGKMADEGTLLDERATSW